MVSSEASLNILKTLDAIMTTFLQFPAALAADFDFLGEHLLHALVNVHMDYEDVQNGPSNIASHELNLERRDIPIRQWDSIENKILHIVTKLANQQPNTISLQTTFFQLGLDSINAVQIASQLRQKGQKVSPIEVLEVSFKLISYSLGWPNVF